MPQLGETVTEGTITRWLKQVGDQVAEDEVLFEVSTDKVDSEVPSPVAGVLTEILVPEGDTVDVGTRLAVISDGADGAGPGRRPAQPAGAPSPSPQPEAAALEPSRSPSRSRNRSLSRTGARTQPAPAAASGRRPRRPPRLAAPTPDTAGAAAPAGCSPRWCAA